MMSEERVRTGIAELDRMLSGGFMRGDAVMILGSAGLGKTTLGLQYLVNGATMFGEHGLYVTFEQLPDQIYRDAKSFGWDIRSLEAENKLRVVCTSPDLLLDAKGEERLLDSFIKSVHARRIVIDSLSHLAMFVGETDQRRETYRLIRYLKTKGLSSLLLYESSSLMGNVTSLTESGTSFLVDCIVMLKPVEIESSMRKAIAVLKMRGSDHDKRLREYEVTAAGAEVGRAFTEYEGIMTGSARKATKMEQAVGRFSEAFADRGKRQ